MGFLYKFTLTLGMERHRFEMSEFTAGQTHVYSHIQEADQLTCDSQSGSCTVDTTDRDSDKSTFRVLSQNIWNFFTVERTEEDYVRRIEILGSVSIMLKLC